VIGVIRYIAKTLHRIHDSTIQRFNDSTGRNRSSFRDSAVTIIELLLVITVILILAGLILSISSYVQNKGARARAEAEIAAMSAALESYKADNGIYPRDNPGSTYTDSLNARSLPSPAPSPSPNVYTNAAVFLYTELSGLDTTQQPIANKRAYFSFRPQMLGHPSGNSVTVAYLRDPFGNCYGYSTANQGSSNSGFNPTFDLWSTANDKTGNTSAWIKNW
jgi:type II secretory pathway pseudopilin PulG